MVNKNKSAIEKDIESHNVQFLEGNDSELMQTIEVLQNPKHIESNTIFDDNRQVNAFALMNWAGQVYDIAFFKHYVSVYPKYRISGDNGRGRSEIIQIAEAIRRDRIDSNKQILEILRGK